jgi:transposase
VSALLGLSAQRMLKALADGETNPAALAALADRKLHATQEQLCDALGACTELNAVYRRLLSMMLEELRLIDEQIGKLNQEMANLLRQHQDAVERLAEVPGLGVDSAQQIIAEVGATAATFPSEKHLSSWVGACPGEEESAGVNYSHRSPKGNRDMRRILNQAANAAVKAKGTIFEIVYRRMVPRLGHKQTIGVVVTSFRKASCVFGISASWPTAHAPPFCPSAFSCWAQPQNHQPKNTLPLRKTLQIFIAVPTVADP